MTRALALALLLAVTAGCAGPPFRVKVSGEVVFADKDAPREFKSGVYTSTESATARQQAGGKTAPADKGSVTVTLKFKNEQMLQSVLPLIPDQTVNGRFHLETKSESFDALDEIWVAAESAGRTPELRKFTTPKGVPFEESLYIVLEFTPLVAPPPPVAPPKGVAPTPSPPPPDASANAAQKK
jgi:hypothetical protein